MPTLSASGIGSGLDVKGIVSALVAAERAPGDSRIKRTEKDVNAKISSLGKLTSALSKFESSLKTLKSADSYQGRVTTSSDEDSVKAITTTSATGTSKAVAGTYTVDLSGSGDQLAQAQKLSSAGYAAKTSTLNTGTLAIELGTYDGSTYTSSSSVSITIDSSNNTLEGVRDAINNASVNVSASIVFDGSNYRLALSSDDSGIKNTIKTSGVTGLAYDPTSGTNDLTQTVASQDAKFSIDGVSVTSSSNTVTDAIQGVTLELQKTGTGATSTIVVGPDKEESKKEVQAFVDNFNALVKVINSESKAGINGTNGSLVADSAVRGLNSKIHQVISSASTTSGINFSNLGEIGISTNVTDGTLKLDSAKLDSALVGNFDDLGKLMSEYGTNLLSKIDAYIGTTDNVFKNRTDGLNKQLEQISKQKLYLDSRMESVQARYLKQFNALDGIVAQMNNTMNSLMGQLASLPGAARRF